MKKIIFWGDGILAGSAGFAELLSNHILVHHPMADVKTYLYGAEATVWQDVSKETPLHVIGKAPDLVVLGLGYADLAAGRSPEEIAKAASVVISLILQKTQARICLLSTVSGFLVGDERERCQALNRLMRELAGPRVDWVDLEPPVAWFFNEHSQGAGEKHSLHLDAHRLTALGRLFMAHHAFHLIAWPQGLSDAVDEGIPAAGPVPF